MHKKIITLTLLTLFLFQAMPSSAIIIMPVITEEDGSMYVPPNPRPWGKMETIIKTKKFIRHLQVALSPITPGGSMLLQKKVNKLDAQYKEIQNKACFMDANCELQGKYKQRTSSGENNTIPQTNQANAGKESSLLQAASIVAGSPISSVTSAGALGVTILNNKTKKTTNHNISQRNR